MTRKFTLLVGALLAAGAIAAVPAVSGAAGKGKTVATAKCTATFTNGTPGKLKGFDFGFVKCAHFGNYVQVTHYTETIGAGGKATASGNAVIYGALGTVSGPYKLAGTVAGPAFTVAGTAKLAHGTGGYTHRRGSAHVTCSTTDGGNHLSCKYTIRYTHL